MSFRFGRLVFIVTATLVLGVSDARAQIQRAELYNVPGDTELSSFSRATRGHPSGLSVVGSSVGYQGTAVWRPTPSSGEVRLVAGQKFLLCFTPTRDMYVRVIVFLPSGAHESLFPSGPSAPQLSGNFRYCLGDRNSETTFTVPSAPGRGRVWIVGSPDGEPPLPAGIRIPGGAPNNSNRLFEARINFRIVN
jgi:hypothetical protein